MVGKGVLVGKQSLADNYMAGQRQLAYNYCSVCAVVPDEMVHHVLFSDYAAPSIEDAVGLKKYNSASGPPRVTENIVSGSPWTTFGASTDSTPMILRSIMWREYANTLRSKRARSTNPLHSEKEENKCDYLLRFISGR